MIRSPDMFLDDIIDAIKSIFAFIKGMDYKEFHSDDKTQSAVIRKMEVIGEAVKGLPSEMRDAHDEIPWSYMAKMRDKLIHGYFGVDSEIIWEVIQKRFKEILPRLEDIKNKKEL